VLRRRRNTSLWWSGGPTDWRSEAPF